MSAFRCLHILVRHLMRDDAVELRCDSQNESTERGSECLMSLRSVDLNRFESVALTFSGLGSSRSTSIAWISLGALALVATVAAAQPARISGQVRQAGSV